MSPTPVPAFVQSTSAQDEPVNVVTTSGMTTTNGNFLVAMAARNNAGSLVGATVTDNYGNSWINAWTDPNINGTFGSGGLYYAQDIRGGGGHTVTFTMPGGTDGLALAVAEFANVALTFALNSTAHTFNQVPAVALPPILSSPLSGVTAGQLLIGSGSASHGNQPPASIGRFTDLWRESGSSHGGVILSYVITSAVEPAYYSYTTGTVNNRSESYGLATFTGTGIAYVQQIGVASSGIPASITTPAITTTAGNFIVVIATAETLNLAGGSLTDNYSNTWQTAWITNSGSDGNSALYYAENCLGGAGHTFTLSIGGAALLTSLSVAEFSGVDLSGSLDQFTTTSGNTRPYTTATVTPSQAEELLIGGGSVSFDAFLGYSIVPLDWNTVEALHSNITNADEGVILAYQIAPADGTYEYGMNTGAEGSTSWEAVGIASFLPGEPVPFVNPTTNTIQIRRMRRTPHLNQLHKRITYSRFELLAQVGEGLLSGQGSDPQICLRWSDDGGRTWSREHWTTLGKIGEYRTRVLWRRLGQARDRVFEISVSDPVDVALITAYLDANVGTN